MFAFDFRESIWRWCEIYARRIHLEKRCLRKGIERFPRGTRVLLTRQGHIIQVDENFMIVVENLIAFLVIDRAFNTSDHGRREISLLAI